MKNLTTYCTLIFLIIFLTSCDDPNPTELLFDDTAVDEDIEVDLVADDPNTFVYTNGYDSTGIVESLPRSYSIIYLTGSKYSINNVPFREINHAEAVFYDRNRPLRTNSGTEVGFHSNYVGRVFFGEDSALVRSNRISFVENGLQRSVNAGFKYVLSQRVNLNTGQNKFPFGQRVQFRLVNPLNGRVQESLQIPTPLEITGLVLTSGSVQNGDLRINLQWSNSQSSTGRIRIVIGGILRGTDLTFPIYDVNVKDNGIAKIPKWMIDNIQFERFDSLVITFIRQLEFSGRLNDNTLSDSFIVAQSIHNVILVP